MSQPSSHTQNAQRESTLDSSSDSPSENPIIRPRVNLNPTTATVTDIPPSASSADHLAVLRELCQRESELTRRTSDIEKLLVSITTAINQQHPCPATSTPITRPPSHNIPYNPALSSDQHVPQSATAPTFPLAPQSSQSTYPESVVREALDLVPKFDGHNIPVLQFSRACKRAKELLPFTNEAYLVRLLRSKLSNHAYLAVEDETHDTVNKFIDSLKRTFGPSRSSNYYRGQLSVNYKKRNEHILDYVSRVKDLRSAIIEGDQTDEDRPLSRAEIARIDTFTLESFIEGLPAEYRAEIRMERDDTLKDVYYKAISISKRLERDRARSQDPRYQQPIPPASFPAQSLNTAAPMQPPVTILKRPSPPLPRASDFQPPPNQSPSPFPTKICHYCKRFGHLISECRKRQYNENNNYTRQGNLPQVSASEESRGLPNTHRALPLTENHPPSTSSDPQPGTSRQ